MRIYASELSSPFMNADFNSDSNSNTDSNSLSDIQSLSTPIPIRTTSPIRWTPGPSHKKRNYSLIAIAIVAVYIYFNVDLSCKENFEKTFDQIFDIKKLPKNLVILSATLNPRYLFVLSFAVQSWKELGVHPIVILVGQRSAFYSNKQSRLTLKLLDEQNAFIQFIEPKRLSPASMSQIIRLFGSALPFSTGFPINDTILITSDADLAVFDLYNHIPNISEGKTLHLYNSKCCKPVKIPSKRGDSKVPMFPIGTIAATTKQWREIMGFKNVSFTVKEIEDYVIEEFGDDFFHPNDEKNPGLVGSSIWYADQSLISYKISEWLKNPKSMLYKTEHSDHPKRIDRMAWPSESKFSRLESRNFDDCHLPTAAYMDGEWEKFSPFLKFAFPNNHEIVQRFIKYREDFVNRDCC